MNEKRDSISGHFLQNDGKIHHSEWLNQGFRAGPSIPVRYVFYDQRLEIIPNRPPESRSARTSFCQAIPSGYIMVI